MRFTNEFRITTDKKPAGDQPKAIESLCAGLDANVKHQTLLGVTGSGKTFTAAKVIEAVNKPTLVIAHNKTLAAQLAQEYRELFPDNTVRYFVSYYDYYQPEAYVPGSDTYIAKEALINKEIDRLRHAATQDLLTRSDVVVVASVSCIYGLGSPKNYEQVHVCIQQGMEMTRESLVRKAISLHFERKKDELQAGTIRVIAGAVEIMPVNEEVIYRIAFSGSTVEKITCINALTRAIEEESVQSFFLFPAKHFVSGKEDQQHALGTIAEELAVQLKQLEQQGKALEKERLRRRTLQDMTLIEEIGYCNGIENYSRHFDRRREGEPPYTLLSYFPHAPDGTPDFLTIIDESHVTVPQIAGMYAGDRSRKDTLVEHGFRLPSARDNRPLTFEEFEDRIGQVLYTSATPGEYEQEKSGKKHIVTQIIRPTGLTDPTVEIHPVTGEGSYGGQVRDFIAEAKKEIAKKNRVLVTTLTKRTAEDLTKFLEDEGLRTNYVHSDVKTIERIEILTNFRKGVFDILVGVNLLREGLDLPEVTLVAILDADKEGFLRSETSLIQTIGRAARNVDGRVLLYADIVKGGLKRAVEETERRREIQIAYNKKHGITPKTIQKNITDITDEMEKKRGKTAASLVEFDIEQYRKAPKKTIQEKERKMADAVAMLDFETAAIIRDEIQYLENL